MDYLLNNCFDRQCSAQVIIGGDQGDSIILSYQKMPPACKDFSLRQISDYCFRVMASLGNCGYWILVSFTLLFYIIYF